VTVKIASTQGNGRLAFWSATLSHPFLIFASKYYLYA
jgi:hypothetical protein